MNCSEPRVSVNPFLCLKNGAPIVNLPSAEIPIPDSNFGRFFIRSRFTHLDASPEGLAWYRVDAPDALVLKHMRLEPMLHQKLSVYRLDIGNTALWHDMGLGKTYTTLAYIVNRNVPLTLVLCPKTVFVQWQDEIDKSVEPGHRPKFFIAHGPQRQKALAAATACQKPAILLTTYGTLEKIRAKLETLPIGAVFADEASQVKNIGAARTRALHALVNKVRNNARICLLSGTPSTTTPVGYYSLYTMLDPRAPLCASETAFKHHFTEVKKFMVVRIDDGFGGERPVHIYQDRAQRWLETNFAPNTERTYAQLGYTFEESTRPGQNHIKIVRRYEKPVGVKNVEQLKQIHTTWSYALKKEDVLNDLPEKTLQVREIELSAEQSAAYQTMLTTRRVELASTKLSFRHSDNVFTKLTQIANGYLIDESKKIHYFKQQPKLDALIDMLDETGDQKIVVWSPWLPQIAMIEARLQSEELNFVSVKGGTSSHDRQEHVHRFQRDPDCRVFVSNPSVGGLGLNLVCACIEVFMSNWYAPDIRSQAEDRCYRKGQKSAVNIYDFVAPNTLESAVRSALLQKINLENTLLSMKEIGA